MKYFFIIFLYINFALYFSTATNIPSKSSDCASTSEISELEEDAAHM